MKEEMRIGLIGFGNIGTGVVNTLNKKFDRISSHLKKNLKLVRIADIDVSLKRDADYDPDILTTDADDVVNASDIDIVIELTGVIEPARTFIENALKSGKHVVTANKALLAKHGADLWQVALRNNVALLFEASVGGGIPIIRTMLNGLPANDLLSISGIVNGTANFILTKMTREGKEFDTVLREAQELGLAEPDPTFDIEGIDSGHKIAILASIAFGQDIRGDDVHVEGMSRVTSTDIRFAKEFGYVIKLLASARKDVHNGSVEVLVAPTLLPKDSMLGSVSNEFNAVLVKGDVVGELMFYGKGAGPDPTSSAVIGDIVSIVRNLDEEGRYFPSVNLDIPIGEKNIKPASEMEAVYCIRFSALDKPGTMAKISRVLADSDISIKSLFQHGEHAPHEYVPLIIITHTAIEANVQEALKKIKHLDIVADEPFVLRVKESDR